MDAKILITYASKRGATAEIAERIGDVLRREGLQADVLPVGRTGEVSDYGAVVLGSAVYLGKWRKEAAAFLTANERNLATRPVWLFSSGPTQDGGAFLKGENFPAALQPVADRIGPRSTVVFWGCVDMGKLNPLEKMAIRNTKTPLDAWASGIVHELA